MGDVKRIFPFRYQCGRWKIHKSVKTIHARISLQIETILPQGLAFRPRLCYNSRERTARKERTEYGKQEKVIPAGPG
jgi:hypothetical protein